jgi:hypothetical protein
MGGGMGKKESMVTHSAVNDAPIVSTERNGSHGVWEVYKQGKE